MQKSEKQQIVNKLNDYIDHVGSLNKAANTMKGISSATLSQMMNGKWDLIKDDMWRKVAAQIGHSSSDWELVKTNDFKLLSSLLKDSQEHANVHGIIGSAGSGKSKALQEYTLVNKQAYLLSCNEYWNRKFFLSELLSSMGRDSSGFTVAEMMQEVVSTLQKQDKPIIIMDEADKLNDQVLYFFITIYNQLEDHCGIVLCATSHLKKRIIRGVKLNKKGYNEIFSRIGRKFIELNGVGPTDVTQICMANGIENKVTIKEIVNKCENDLRRVKRMVHAAKMKSNHLNKA